MKLKKVLAMTLAGLMTLSLLSACSSSTESTSTESTTTSSTSTESATTESVEQLKVAWMCDGVLTDGGWNTDGYTAMQELAEIYNFDVSYQENVPYTEVADVLRNYAADGYDLVLSNEQYHCEDMAAVAAEFPNTFFGCVNGYVSADNMIAVTGDMWQHIYLSGVMSAMVSETGKIGLITYSTDSDSALTMKAAYIAGAQSVDPDIQMIHVATGSFSDLAVGKEMTTSLIDQGCDVVMCNSGDCNETSMEVCIEAGVYTISSIVDRNYMDADYVIGSAMIPPSGILPVILEGYFSGTLTGTAQVMGLAEGVEEYRVNPDFDISDEVLAALEEATAGIIDGSITVELP